LRAIPKKPDIAARIHDSYCTAHVMV